ncbi:hydrolase [Candidatus Poribacteria bacterium]|nr:hydrolase [Candidatus Poribacteria bacterium]
MMRHVYVLEKENTLLLVVDYQKKLLAAFKEPEAPVQNCIKLIKFAKIMGIPIIWTEQYPKGLGPTTDAVRNELMPCSPIEKLTFSCFGEPRFVSALSSHSQGQLMVCGIETHICVEQTSLDGIAAGYQVHVVADACASRRIQDHEIGLHKIEQAGGVLTCSEMAMYEILRAADAKEFREVLKIVK